ncbi:hypothetical protein EYC84_005947 [Monilinia fructicola]|uniref:Uncharacterized protein n=1 Tax=Monilinia fructicola TaxID=38448 RepID=A0A5M9K3B1_MONFR|nr:hypothetical protein EYC84_005947 [Monilinia fructicola]
MGGWVLKSIRFDSIRFIPFRAIPFHSMLLAIHHHPSIHPSPDADQRSNENTCRREMNRGIHTKRAGKKVREREREGGREGERENEYTQVA